jgi:hypothetical protein
MAKRPHITPGPHRAASAAEVYARLVVEKKNLLERLKAYDAGERGATNRKS